LIASPPPTFHNSRFLVWIILPKFDADAHYLNTRIHVLSLRTNDLLFSANDLRLRSANSAIEAGAGVPGCRGAGVPRCLPLCPGTPSTAICSGLPVHRLPAHPLSHGHQVTRDHLRRINPGSG